MKNEMLTYAYRLLLTFQAVFFTFSSIMYTIEGSDKWFSRLALSLILFGFLYIGREIRSLKENK